MMLLYHEQKDNKGYSFTKLNYHLMKSDKKIGNELRIKNDTYANYKTSLHISSFGG